MEILQLIAAGVILLNAIMAMLCVISYTGGDAATVESTTRGIRGIIGCYIYWMVPTSTVGVLISVVLEFLNER